ncbi:MAG: hypothetical protein ACP5NO_08270 [Thermoplasmata archaeon]
MALDIFSMMHQESAGKLRESMKSWILQIDGTLKRGLRVATL